MNYNIYITLFVTFCFQITFSQYSSDKKYEKAKEFFNEENFHKADSLIKEVKKPYKSIPPRIAYLEILIKNKLINTDKDSNFTLLEETKKLVTSYKNKFIKYQNDNYKEVVKIGNELNKFAKDPVTFKAQIEQKQKEIIFEKERLVKLAIEVKQKAEADRIKKIEDDKIKNIVIDRKNRLRPYSNPDLFSEYDLAKFSESEFNIVLDKEIRESILKKQKEKKIKEIENFRHSKLQPYLSYVNSYDKFNLGTYSDKRFEEIFDKAKSDFKEAKKRNKSQFDSFSSIGIQSGEIARYGFIYERGGRKTVGFRVSGRTSLTPEQDIINGTIKKNKTEIELGPNFSITNRLYFNLGVGYGFYNKIINNDYSGSVFVEKTGFSVANTGVMFRISKKININTGLSFMDIEKEIYTPEITFGASYNFNKNNTNSSYSYSKGRVSNTKREKNSISNYSSFSSLGFYGGKNAKYGLLYESGGNSNTGFHISARTSLKEEKIVNGQLILNRSELELGPNFKLSNQFYLNLGIGYGIYDYGYSKDNYRGTVEYFTANTGVVFRVSEVINLNTALYFENFVIDLNSPEITFGISFNLWD